MAVQGSVSIIDPPSTYVMAPANSGAGATRAVQRGPYFTYQGTTVLTFNWTLACQAVVLAVAAIIIRENPNITTTASTIVLAVPCFGLTQLANVYFQHAADNRGPTAPSSFCAPYA